MVLEPEVSAEMGVAGEDLVGPLSREHHLVAGIPHGAAEQVLGHPVRVVRQRLGVRDRVGEVVGQIRLRDRDRVELGIREPGHLPRDRRLVVVRPVEAQGERPDRIGSMGGRQSQHGARVEPAA